MPKGWTMNTKRDEGNRYRRQHRKLVLQALNRRQHRHGRRDDAIGQQCGPHRRQPRCKPTVFLAYQRIERQNAAFTVVVRFQRDDDIFQCGLQCQRPNDARHRAQYVIGAVSCPIGRLFITTCITYRGDVPMSPNTMPMARDNAKNVEWNF